jgi:hypothetical protein
MIAGNGNGERLATTPFPVPRSPLHLTQIKGLSNVRGYVIRNFQGRWAAIQSLRG